MKHILFLQPLYYDPTLANFKDRYEMLSEHCSGHVISSTDREFKGLKFGNFGYHGLKYVQNKWFRYLVYFFKTLRLGLKLNKEKRFDYVYCYDPLFFGFEGLILNLIFNCKLIIEVNGHFHKAGNLSNKFSIKRCLVDWLLKRSFKAADRLKFLNKEQMVEYAEILDPGKGRIFPDFVPTHVFDPKKATDENYIFLIGHPFHIKGVDVLIEAFNKISHEFPEMKLKIVGHCHGGDVERQKYVDMAEGNTNVEILKPVYYDEATDLFHKCTMFVLPSRTEAMGRVLIEAMACAKAVIGSNVGGIPQVIDNGVTGLIFESENVDDLAEKMQMLLSDKKLREKLAQGGYSKVQSKLSSQQYVKEFLKLLEGD